MRRLNLDAHEDAVKNFVLNLPAEPGGLVLEIGGCPLVRVSPARTAYDPALVKAAILTRRDESRTLNDDWIDADRQAWDRVSEDER